ncbi:MAG: SpoIIIAH-like family protein [Defluviitaleaceae bacterium]|nr:SpoIIIAH-like family protein [Defluviitaleaceae bacterium]MCL2264169.1 SpoIIIAH-like family protein [Defluviitaleaceae bacterium]
MFVLKRNQIIITALVVMIAVAGYLSWNDTRGGELTVGYLLTDQGEVAALIPDSGALISLFPEDYPGLIGAWTTTHDPAIAVSGDDFQWGTLTGLDLSDIMALPTNEEHISEAGEAIFVNQSRDSTFVQNRLSREQSRSSERSILNELINNANVSDQHRAEAADAMLEIQRRIERETAAEALIESKGFAEAYVRISETSVDVIVSNETLSEAELAQIVEIIKRKTGMDATQIHVSPMRRG